MWLNLIFDVSICRACNPVFAPAKWLPAVFLEKCVACGPRLKNGVHITVPASIRASTRWGMWWVCYQTYSL